MRIAILTPTFCKFSGIDRVAELQAKDFAMNCNSVTVFTLEADMKPPQDVRLEILGMPRSLLWQRIYRLLFPLDFVKAIKWVPKLKFFDVVYSHQYPMNWLAYLAKRLYGVKYIYYDHGIAFLWLFPNFAERAYMSVLSLLTTWTVRRADGAISVSQFLQRRLKEETGVDAQVVYNHIDTERFHKDINSSEIRKRYKIGDAPLVLYVGRVSPHKGVHLLIEAFNLVKQEIPDARLLVAGKHTFSDYSRRLRAMADDSAIFADYVPDEDLPLHYAACDVFATGSLWEGFNLPLAEAQACGKPVVAFGIGAHPEVVKSNKVGLLIPAGDTEGLAKAIAQLLKASRGKASISRSKEPSGS